MKQYQAVCRAKGWKLCATLALVLGSSWASVARADSGTLLARDYNLDGVIDAYYDSATNLTWLADANAIHTSGYQDPRSESLASRADGAVTWFTATFWAANLDVHGVTGWRLPSLSDQSSCTSVGFHQVCATTVVDSTSEIGRLFHATLGNAQGQIANTGPFLNVQANDYWSGRLVSKLYGSPPVWAYKVSTDGYEQLSQSGSAFAWAVHDGDVAAPVPEPASAALGFVAFACMAVRRRINAWR